MNHGCDMEFIENAFSSANMQVLLSTKKKKNMQVPHPLLQNFAQAMHCGGPPMNKLFLG